MIKLTKEQILLLHTQLIETTGGSDGIRDLGLLESALESPFQSYGGEELYPSIQAKAARLCYGLVKNHAMIDGNKRIGCHVSLFGIKWLWDGIHSERIIRFNIRCSSGQETI